MTARRRLLTALPLAAAALGLSRARAAEAPKPAPAAKAEPKNEPRAEPKAERFPGDPPEHKVVYQLNRVEADYIEAILNSVGAMLGKYQDNVAIAVVVFGPGIHLLAKRPKRPVPAALRERVVSQARDYGVTFVACGNTMKTLGWSAEDIVAVAKVEEVGAAALMEYQEQGYAYVAW